MVKPGRLGSSNFCSVAFSNSKVSRGYPIVNCIKNTPEYVNTCSKKLNNTGSLFQVLYIVTERIDKIMICTNECFSHTSFKIRFTSTYLPNISE